jgi:hypothetical protein
MNEPFAQSSIIRHCHIQPISIVGTAQACAWPYQLSSPPVRRHRHRERRRVGCHVDGDRRELLRWRVPHRVPVQDPPEHLDTQLPGRHRDRTWRCPPCPLRTRCACTRVSPPTCSSTRPTTSAKRTGGDPTDNRAADNPARCDVADRAAASHERASQLLHRNECLIHRSLRGCCGHHADSTAAYTATYQPLGGVLDCARPVHVPAGVARRCRRVPGCQPAWMPVTINGVDYAIYHGAVPVTDYGRCRTGAIRTATDRRDARHPVANSRTNPPSLMWARAGPVPRCTTGRGP